jgi:hypothetical protein
MKRWSWHWTRVLLLAVLLGLGMSLSSVQGGVMATEMGVATHDAHHGRPSGCGGCEQQGMNASTCLVLCGIVVQALVPAELLTLPSAFRIGFQVARLHLSSQFDSPEHGPPKILILG